MIKLLALDMDGTCLTPNTTVDKETKEAVLEAIDKGIIVVPATGRSLSTMPEDAMKIYDYEYLITSNGASVYKSQEDLCIPVGSISYDQMSRILDILEGHDVYKEFYIDEKNYITQEDLERLDRYIQEVYMYMYEDEIETVSMEEIEELLKTGTIQKLEYRFPLGEVDPEEDRELLEKIMEIGDLSIDVQVEGSREVTHRRANKGNALKQLAEELGIAREEIMAIGDSGNDRKMLEYVGLPVAMGQADDEVKKIAKYVTDTNSNNGVSKAIKALILNEASDL